MEKHRRFTADARGTAVALGLLAALAVTGSARAQTRTPTSPLDRPVDPPPVTAPQPAIPSPAVAAALPVPTRIELPSPVRDAAPIDRTALLPDGISSSSGLAEEEVVARVEQTGIAARRARARVEATEAAERVARRGYVPRASATARYTRLSSYTPGSITSFNTAGCVGNIPDCQANPQNYYVNVVLQQPILNQYAMVGNVTVPLSDYVGATRTDLAAARADAEAARAQARASLDDARLGGRDAYWELVRARAQLRLAEDSAANETRKLGETRQRRQAGIATDADVQQAEATERAYRQLVEVASTRADVAERVLRDLLGMADSDSLELSVDLERLPSLPAIDAQTARSQAERTAPGVVAARSSADAAGARVSTERSRMFPSVSAQFNYQYMNPNSRIFPQTTTFTGTWDAMVQATWSLDGMLLAQGRTSQRRALAEDAALAAEEAEQTAGRVAIEARGQWLAALANVEAREAATGSAQTAARSAAERRAAGIATETELRDADAAYLRARLDLVDAIVDVHRAHARFVSALGELPDAPHHDSTTASSTVPSGIAPSSEVTP